MINKYLKQIIKLFLKEIIPIIVGILVALYINNWNEERKNENYINQISLSINKELKETNEEIIKKLSSQKSLIDTLDYYLANNTISLIDIILKNNGIKAPRIKVNSWKAVSTSKIELLEYDKMTTLADIEEQKAHMNMKLDKLLTFLYANSNETGKSKKILMKIMIADVINSEIGIKSLIIHYQHLNSD